MFKSLPWAYVPPETEALPSLRRALASVLFRAAQMLVDTERRGRRHGGVPVLEFHAEAGAPEGALYVDGQLVGHLHGVTRL